MKVLLPITYFGSIDYYAILAQADEVHIEKHESYQRQTLRNRCKILGVNGPMELSIPVAKQENKLISLIQTDESTPWRVQHLHALLSAYKKSPFFEFVEADIAQFYKLDGKYLFDNLYANTLQWCKWIGIKTPVFLTEHFSKNPSPDIIDYRGMFKPSKNPCLFSYPTYHQVFAELNSFQENLSILDLFCNEGRNSLNYLKQIKLDL